MEIESYITGFVDGEGCFSVSFSVRKKMKYGIEVRPSFALSQHRRNKEIILFLQQHFQCGGVRYSASDQNYKFEVRSVEDLIKRIIPHFEKYPLQTSKKDEFERFRAICRLLYSNHHKNAHGMREIITLSENLNVGGKKKYDRQYLLKLIAR